MSLRFFADHCISSFMIRTLRDAGYEVLRLQDFIPVESPDSTVISKAQYLGAILLSLNGDFSDIVAYPPSRFIGIIGLQVRNHPEIAAAIMQRLLQYLKTYPSMDHYRGKLLVVDASRIRMRK